MKKGLISVFTISMALAGGAFVMGKPTYNPKTDGTADIIQNVDRNTLQAQLNNIQSMDSNLNIELSKLLTREDEINAILLQNQQDESDLIAAIAAVDAGKLTVKVST